MCARKCQLPGYAFETDCLSCMQERVPLGCVHAHCGGLHVVRCTVASNLRHWCLLLQLLPRAKTRTGLCQVRAVTASLMNRVLQIEIYCVYGVALRVHVYACECLSLSL